MLTAAATKTKPIGDCDDRRFTIIINSVSMAALIGLPPKMAEFCHTSNRSLLGRQCCRALSRLYFNSSATGRSVRNKGCRALGGSLQKDKRCPREHLLKEILKALFIPWYDIVLPYFRTYDFCDRWESKRV